jgi:hypothetical protein
MHVLVSLFFSIIACFFVAIPQRSLGRYVIAFTIAAAWIGGLYYTTLDGQFLRDHGIKSRAVITQVECSGSSGTFVSFVFSHLPGHYTESRQWLHRAKCSHFAIGDKVDIVFSPQNPALNVVGIPEKNSPGLMTAFFVLVFSMMILGNAHETKRKAKAGRARNLGH